MVAARRDVVWFPHPEGFPQYELCGAHAHEEGHTPSRRAATCTCHPKEGAVPDGQEGSPSQRVRKPRGERLDSLEHHESTVTMRLH